MVEVGGTEVSFQGEAQGKITGERPVGIDGVDELVDGEVAVVRSVRARASSHSIGNGDHVDVLSLDSVSVGEGSDVADALGGGEHGGGRSQTEAEVRSFGVVWRFLLTPLPLIDVMTALSLGSGTSIGSAECNQHLMFDIGAFILLGFLPLSMPTWFQGSSGVSLFCLTPCCLAS